MVGVGIAARINETSPQSSERFDRRDQCGAGERMLRPSAGLVRRARYRSLPPTNGRARFADLALATAGSVWGITRGPTPMADRTKVTASTRK